MMAKKKKKAKSETPKPETAKPETAKPKTTGKRLEVLVENGTSRRVLPEEKALKLIAEDKAILIEETTLPLS